MNNDNLRSKAASSAETQLLFSAPPKHESLAKTQLLFGRPQAPAAEQQLQLTEAALRLLRKTPPPLPAKQPKPVVDPRLIQTRLLPVEQMLQEAARIAQPARVERGKTTRTPGRLGRARPSGRTARRLGLSAGLAVALLAAIGESSVATSSKASAPPAHIVTPAALRAAKPNALPQTAADPRDAGQPATRNSKPAAVPANARPAAAAIATRTEKKPATPLAAAKGEPPKHVAPAQPTASNAAVRPTAATRVQPHSSALRSNGKEVTVPPPAPRPRTAPRAAADALAAGDIPAAATFYSRLAEQEPRNKAYEVAARILAERAPQNAR